MGWLGNFELDRANDMFWQRHTLSNGQVCMIGFVRDFSDGGTEEYNVVFAVADKKKQLRAFFEGLKKILSLSRVLVNVELRLYIGLKTKFLSLRRKSLDITTEREIR